MWFGLSTHIRQLYGIKKRVYHENLNFRNTRRGHLIYSRLRLGQFNQKARRHLIARHSICLCDNQVTVQHFLCSTFALPTLMICQLCLHFESLSYRLANTFFVVVRICHFVMKFIHGYVNNAAFEFRSHISTIQPRIHWQALLVNRTIVPLSNRSETMSRDHIQFFSALT